MIKYDDILSKNPKSKLSRKLPLTGILNILRKQLKQRYSFLPADETNMSKFTDSNHYNEATPHDP